VDGYEYGDTDLPVATFPYLLGNLWVVAATAPARLKSKHREMENKANATTDANSFPFTFHRPLGGYRNVVQRAAPTTCPAVAARLNTLKPSKTADDKEQAMVDAASIRTLHRPRMELPRRLMLIWT
jgi:hypothetical protein